MPSTAPSTTDVADSTKTRSFEHGPPQLQLSAVTSSHHHSGATAAVPSSPPPTYEKVLEENRIAAAANQLGRAASLEAASGSASGGREVEKMPPRPSTAPPGASLQIQHKSSKELYRAVAAQWGLTCKMSDKCRCLDCQGRYFDCDYEQNEHNKNDGGLGATTPMFISEVMAGSACTVL